MAENNNHITNERRNEHNKNNGEAKYKKEINKFYAI